MNNRSCGKLAAFCLALASTSLLAAEPAPEPLDPGTNKPLFFVTGTYARPDNGRGTQDRGTGGQIGFGIPLSDYGHWWVEGRADYIAFETGSGRGTDFYQTTVGADLQYAFGDRERLTPFALLGLGYTYNDVVPDRDDAGSLTVEGGVGVVGRLGRLRWLRGRADARAVYDTFRSGQLDLRVHAGLEVSLSSAPGSAPAPTPAPVVAPPPEIIERRVEVRVVETAPPDDDDHDRVINIYDDCPNTLPGLKVNNHGCVESEQTIVLLRNVSFDFDSSRLQLNGQYLLDSVMVFLLSQPNIQGEFVGHTDSRGSDEYNQKLSERRAAAAVQYVVGKGIAASRLASKGMGERQPIASNDTDIGRETNRRVEFRIFVTPTAPAPVSVPAPQVPTSVPAPPAARIGLEDSGRARPPLATEAFYATAVR